VTSEYPASRLWLLPGEGLIVFVLPGMIVHAHDEYNCIRTSSLVHEARGMASIKKWLVRFLQRIAASFHLISGAEATP
jgi:hypothetical protein